jgi:hypothetical protein
LNFGGGGNETFKTTLNVLSKKFYLLRGENYIEEMKNHPIVK